jgi:hypothetical protein
MDCRQQIFEPRYQQMKESDYDERCPLPSPPASKPLSTAIKCMIPKEKAHRQERRWAVASPCGDFAFRGKCEIVEVGSLLDQAVSTMPFPGSEKEYIPLWLFVGARTIAYFCDENQALASGLSRSTTSRHS